MGNCSTVDGGPCEVQAPMPSSLLWVKVIRVNGIQTPARLNGDTIKKCARQVCGRAHTISIYATISVGKQQGRTEDAEVVDKGDFVLNQPPLPFTLDSIVANSERVSRSLTPPSRNTRSSMSLASTLLDRRIPEMTVKVYRVRRLCRDALIGQGALPICSTELAGTSREHSIDLTNGCGTVSVRCSFNCSLSDLRDLQSVLAAPKQQSSSAKFSRALAQLLQGEDGLQILEKAMPAALVMQCDVGGSRDRMTSTLQSMLVSLCNHVTMLSEDESNSEVTQRLAPLSRSIQDFVAEHAPVGEDVSALATEWLSDIFSICAQKTGLKKGVWSLDIEEFLEAGARYPGIDHLAPINSKGRPFEEWCSAPPTVKREFLPKGAILGQGMFGTVWRAMDLRTSQWYAVKRSHALSREAFVGREREVTNHVMMNPHPFVVQVFGNYVVEGSARLSFLVMEFCSRGDLQIRINSSHQALAYQVPAKALIWMGQILLGLEHLHLVLDMLVRDLKPANVVFSGHDHAKLTDFGMGRIGVASTGCFTLQNCPPGSPAYAAPEVVLQKPYDHRADIYSYGVLCWTLLTGGIRCDGVDWCPPSHKFSPHNFKTLAKNHKLLEKAIRHPRETCAPPLPSERAADFVLAATRPDVEQRLDHNKLRSHVLMANLKLPPPEARRQKLDEWMKMLS